MVRKFSNFKCIPLFSVRMMKLIACISLLLYVVSCSSDDSTPSPSGSSSIDPIRSLTLSGVDESSITLSWDLLKTEEGAVDPTIAYTVYAETTNGEGVFTKNPDTETIYTLSSGSTILPVDGTRTSGIKVVGLVNNTPYRIVVEANDASGNSSQARLLAYTASALTDSDISGLEITTTTDREEITVTWDPKDGAQAYAIQATDGENQFGGNIPTDNIITVICAPDFLLLCESSDQFAQVEDNKLKYTFTVNHRGSRYQLAIIPFNFRDLAGLQAVDEVGVEKALIEEVLAQVKDESSTVGERLKNTIQDPTKVKEAQLQVSVAEAATDLILDSTGNTLSARWGHGIGAEYYHAILTGEGVAVTNTIDRNDPSGRFTGGGYVGFGGLTTNTVYTVTIQSFTVSDNATNLGGEVSATLSTKDASDTLNAPMRIAEKNLILTHEATGKLGVTWNTAESNSVIGYNVFYWTGKVAPDKPQYVAVKGERDLTFTVPPGHYHVRIDVLSIYPGQEVVTGDSSPITIDGNLLPPKPLDSIRALTLSGVDENSISISWDLLKTEEGAVDPTIVYAVYAETHVGDGVFTVSPGTETIYTLFSAVDLGEGKMSTVLPQDATGNRAVGVQVRNLVNDTPYRIVVVANDASGNSSQARLLAYTASALTDSDISGVDVSTTLDSEEVTVTWDPKAGAQGYAIQATDGGNQFGGNSPTDNVITVICPPGFLLCENEDQFAQMEDNKLKYTFTVNHKGSRYKLAIIPFNFQDLAGLQAVDEAGVEKPFIEEVRVQAGDENSVVGQRLKNTLQDPAKVKEFQLQVSVAGAPTDLVLDSTGSTLSASWGHGIGAEYYHAILTNDEVVITNTIDRYEPSGRFTRGGYVGFSNLTANTAYTVTVQSFTVSDGSVSLGGEVSATLSTKDASDTLAAPARIAEENLFLTSEAGAFGVTWNTAESNSVIGYNVFYWIGEVAPTQPQHMAGKGETNLTFPVSPGNYHVRIDVVSIYPGQEVVTGDSKSIMVYGKPLPPQNLAIAFNRGSFTNIGNRLYAIGYPLAFTEARTPAEAGGPVGDLSYHYRYQVEGGEWVGYSEVAGEAMISLQVADLGDAATIKSGYGKRYQVEVIASNAGGLISDAGTGEFTYQSFPEPFNQRDNLKGETGDRSLTVTWPEVNDLNGSTVASYTVVLSVNPYQLPVQSTNTSERRVVFENLVNNQPYFITVIPNGMVTGNILTALSVVTGYTVGAVIEEGSQEDTILTAYTGAPASYTPQGRPGMVVGLAVSPGDDLATVTWSESSIGSPATKYVLEYLSDVAVPITNIDVVGDAADAELSRLSWEGGASVEVTTNDTGSYSHEVRDLDVVSATNVFRVRAVRVDDSKKEWLGEYRYYALGTALSRAPSSVGELTFPTHFSSGYGFTVSWTRPTNSGVNRYGTAAQLVGYRVAWGTNAEVAGGSTEITNIDILSYAIDGLTPGNRYYVLVQAKNDNEVENIYSVGSTKTTYTVKPPDSVTGITYSEHTTNSFKVSWDAVTDTGYGPEGALDSAVTYFIDYLRTGQGSDWQRFSRSDDSATEVILTNLSPGASYNVVVFVVNSRDDRVRTEGTETWTLSPPGPVGDLVVSEPNYDGTAHRGGFKVRWNAPSDTGKSSDGSPASITGYEVAYAEVVEDTPGAYTPMIHGESTPEHVFTDLKTNAQYDIRIRAQTAAGLGVASHVSGWTPSLPGVVDPDLITFSDPSSTTIRIEWTPPPPGQAGGSSSNYSSTSYDVEVAPEGATEEEYISVQSNYSSYFITAANLNKGTRYRARITAKNDWGSAQASVSTNTGTTKAEVSTPPSAVRGLKVESLTDTKVELYWNAPTNKGTEGTAPATISKYIVKYTETSKNNFIEIDETSQEVKLSTNLTGGEKTNVTVTGLSGNTSYTFLVVAVNSGNAVGLDADAQKLEQTTAPNTPKLAQSLTCDKPTSVELEWEVSLGATSYKLYRDNELIGDGDLTNNYYADTKLIPSTPYTYKVQACSDVGCSGDSDPLPITTAAEEKNFRSIIDSRVIPAAADLSGYDERYREIFSLYNSGTPLVARYLKEGGTGDGSSLTTASTNLKEVVDGISDAGVNNVYLVLLTGGTYPTDTVTMKDHVAIVGGVNECLGFSDTVTALKGKGDNRLFYNESVTNVLFYGVTVTNGKASSGSSGGGMYNDNSSPTLTRVIFSGNTATYNGGGMYNWKSSPTLKWVTFSGNTADSLGGGMYNNNSSPTLTRVTFSGNTTDREGGGMYNIVSSPSLVGVTFSENTADREGGGMYNNESSPTMTGVTFSSNTAPLNGGGMYNYQSSPTLTGVTFFENTTDYGGGMYNTDSSSPTLTGVTFSGNTAKSYGGGMFNYQSSPTLIGVTFSGNTANRNGNGMYNDNHGQDGPLIINGIFWGSTANSNPQISFSSVNYGTNLQLEKLRIYNSIVEGGTGDLESGKNYTNFQQVEGGFSPEIEGGDDSSPDTVVIFFANITNADPKLEPLDAKVGSVPTHAITLSTSPAVNQGLYVKRKGTDYYYSTSGEVNKWYKNSPDLSGTPENPPAGAEDLTATDATGYTRTRTDRPDLGAYEFR